MSRDYIQWDHKGQVIPVPEERDYAYQSERSLPGGSIISYPSERDHSDEAKKYSRYELFFHKHTDTAVHFILRKHRRDIVEQRKRNGKAVLYDEYYLTLDFAEFVNRVFGPGCSISTEEEHFPPAVIEAMRQAYR
jgi:hypothetical protein